MKPLISYYFYTLSDFFRYCADPYGTDLIPDRICLPALPLLPHGIAENDKQTLARVLAAENSIRNISKTVEFVIILPYIMHGQALASLKTYFHELTRIADGFLLQNIGDREILRSLLPNDKFLYGDYALNITNSSSAAFWAGKIRSAAILPELPPAKQFALAAAFPEDLIPEITADNNVIVMRSEHCYAAPASGFRCGMCGKDGTQAPALKDRKGNLYPLLCNPLDCNCVLLSPGAEAISQKSVTDTRQKYYNEAEKFTAQYHRQILLRYSFYAPEKREKRENDK